MLLYVLGTGFAKLAVIDTWVSLLWVKRYYPCGEFELILPAADQPPAWLVPDHFVIRDDDDSVMIIEDFKVQTDAENGDTYVITGRSIESILARRIFAGNFALSNTGSIAAAASALVAACTNTPSRQLPGLTIDYDCDIDGTMDVQFANTPLLDAIVAICQPREIGARIVLSGDQMVLRFYQGQEVPVTFSSEYDNLLSSGYTFDRKNYATAAFVRGETQSGTVIGVWRTIGTTGLARREVFVEAQDLKSEVDGRIISPHEYADMLRTKGAEEIARRSYCHSFEAEVEPRTTYQYKKDYDLGDIVTVDNGRGVRAKPRIIEIAESWDADGYTMAPTFSEMEAIL